MHQNAVLCGNGLSALPFGYQSMELHSKGSGLSDSETSAPFQKPFIKLNIMLIAKVLAKNVSLYHGNKLHQTTL